MAGDGLGVIVVDGELCVDGDPAAVLVFLSRQGDASTGSGPLDAEKIVIASRKAAAAQADSSIAWAIVTDAGTP